MILQQWRGLLLLLKKEVHHVRAHEALEAAIGRDAMHNQRSASLRVRLLRSEVALDRLLLVRHPRLVQDIGFGHDRPAQRADADGLERGLGVGVHLGVVGVHLGVHVGLVP